MAKSIGKKLPYVAVGVGMVQVGNELIENDGSFNNNVQRKTAEVGGGLAGAFLLGKLGAATGAGVGAFFFGAGSAPGAVIGGVFGFAGGLIGGYFGADFAGKGYDKLTK